MHAWLANLTCTFSYGYFHQVHTLLLRALKYHESYMKLTLGPLLGFLVTQQISVLQLHCIQSQPSFFCTINPQF